MRAASQPARAVARARMIVAVSAPSAKSPTSPAAPNAPAPMPRRFALIVISSPLGHSRSDDLAWLAPDTRYRVGTALNAWLGAAAEPRHGVRHGCRSYDPMGHAAPPRHSRPGRNTQNAIREVGQRADAAENREAILAAAKRLLEHRPRATVSDIAAAAGVSRATVYRHFKSREALAAAVVDQAPPARAVGPELDRAALAELRDRLVSLPGAAIVPLWLRGRANGVLVALGPTDASLEDLARQASAAIMLADRYTDTFARAQRRKQPKAAAEMQQGMLPPRIARVSGGEVAGNVLPSYEVAGDWFDVVENVDGIWITVADGLRSATRATAAAAVARGALGSHHRLGLDRELRPRAAGPAAGARPRDFGRAAAGTRAGWPLSPARGRDLGPPSPGRPARARLRWRRRPRRGPGRARRRGDDRRRAGLADGERGRHGPQDPFGGPCRKRRRARRRRHRRLPGRRVRPTRFALRFRICGRAPRRTRSCVMSRSPG